MLRTYTIETVNRSQAEPEDGIHRRFYELRFDGERTLSGTVMRYGDTAVMPWGMKERFEPGAFGDVSKLDVLLNVQHDRGRMIARTNGGGMVLEDSPTELRIKADVVKTREGDDAIELVRNKILKGFSVEFREQDAVQQLEGGVPLVVIKSATLRNVGLVDRPAYPKSTVQPRSDAMDEKKLKETLQAALAEEGEKRNEQVLSVVRDTVKTELDAHKAGEQERVDAAVKDAERRAELATKYRSLLPDTFDAKGKTAHEILVAAAGDEVEKASERSEDYLEAKIETIMERREAAGGTRTAIQPAPAPNGGTQHAFTGPMTPHGILALERGKRANG